MASCTAMALNAAAAVTATSVSVSKPVTQYSGLRAAPMKCRISSVRTVEAQRRRFIVSAAVASPQTMDKVVEIIAFRLGKEAKEIKAEQTLTDVGADSLDTVEVMMSLEEEFDVTLDDEKLEKVKTVQEVADLIESLKA
eukprot:TRINITY_DN23585_c0_g1_i1.p1 TRINITY_DN23585_c0_g1~~TRINITY_DN23585_c0_g1_i1.p1  ORF type:complete len:139 (+),score=44.91 TRINITY_DN23585_c0_g1_i1:126-542(+)